jgi:tetratricopeptide (TPR) repeat protein
MRNIHMKVTVTLAVGLIGGAAFLLAGGTVLAAAGKNTNSAAVANLLKPAQEALKNKQYAAALQKIHEAQALPEKTPFDQYTIAEFGCNANIGAGNYADAAKDCETRLNSSFMPEADSAQLTRALLALNFQIKNYDKAIEFGQRAIKGGFATDDNKNLVAQAYYLKGNYKDALKVEQALIDGQIHGGQTPKEDALKLVLSSCVKTEDTACQQHTMERLVAYYPKPDYWTQLLFSLRRQTSTNDTNTLQTYRLMADVDVLKEAGDYNEMAQLALEAGSPGEAQKVLEKGFERGVFSDQRIKDRNQRLLDSVKKTAAGDQASLPKLEKDAETSPTGVKSAAAGLAYYGYGQYDKAADLLNKGVTKGGLSNEAQTRLLLGIAQLKAGHKDDAVKTFKTVKGDPALEQLAGLWVLHAKQA